ncbi:M4 family metallopeptidase [Oxalobacteraceae bacterium OTU3REALA1]|nr:M4 family metallopeptidase [Oxalobacteraceae bacterium OTU3REALA1]
MNLHTPLLATRVATRVATRIAACIATAAMATTAGAQPGIQLMAAPIAPPSPQESAGLVSKLTALERSRGIPADYSFRISGHHPGGVGQKITRAQHTYKGLRVFGSESVVVTNNVGDIVSSSVSDRRPGLVPSAAATPVDMTPALTSEQAIDVAVRSVSPRGVHRWTPSAELLLYPIMKTVRVASAANKPEAELNALDVQDVVERHELAYYVRTRMAQDGKPFFYDTVVNAKTGAIIAQWQALQTVIGQGKSQYNGVVPISTSQSGGMFQMLDPLRGTGGKFGGMAITNADHSSSNNPNPGSVYTNSTNNWGDGLQYNGGSTTDANGQTAAVNALWGLMNTYDTNKNVLGWQSLDGNNTATHIAVHVDRNYDNAFYDDRCKCMYIGDGSFFLSLGSIDVIGHEMSHGVTASTADLIYAGESGGLNESNSDIGGDMVEAYARAGGTGNVVPATGNDWMTGKEISKSGEPLRWMYKPSKDGSSADAWSSSLKNLDVHHSSGPNNRMFYFLSMGSNADPASDHHSKYLIKKPAAMSGIGNDKAYRIWFKALTTKFTSSTNYADARNKVLASAQELYGAGSKEAIAVKRAYAAINVGADIDEEGGDGGGGDATELVVNGGFEDGTTGWRGTTSTIGSLSGQTAHEGTRFAWMGGKGRRTSQTLTQAVTIPAEATSAELSFALHVDSADTTNTAHDTLVVTVRGSLGRVLRTLATYSNVDAADGYKVRTFDLSEFKGRQVTLHFAMRENASLKTSFVLDKVSLLAK